MLKLGTAADGIASTNNLLDITLVVGGLILVKLGVVHKGLTSSSSIEASPYDFKSSSVR